MPGLRNPASVLRHRWSAGPRGFTLVELLVVMAITAILFGLIFGPMYQGFNLTNRARVQVLAQDSARAAMETIQRDMANGVFVFHHLPAAADKVVDPASGASVAIPNGVSLWVNDATGVRRRMILPYGLLDIVPPVRGADQNVTTDPGAIDPTTGLADARGDVALPVSPGRVVIRYFLGLRDNRSTTDDSSGLSLNGAPVLPYLNFYENPRGVSLQQHNPMLLYRAIFTPYLPNLDSAGKVQPDRRLFTVDSSGAPDLYDPNFFHNLTEAGTVTLADGTSTNRVQGAKDDNGDGKISICENWRALARTMVPPDRADEVTLERDREKNILYDAATKLPRVTAHVRMQPTYVGNDAGNPSSLGDPANEAPTVAASTWVETHGAWTVPYRLYVFRSPLNAPELEYFFDDGLSGIFLERYDVAAGRVTERYSAGFNLDARGQLGPSDRPEILFTVDPRRGIVNFAFPDWIVLHDLSGNPAPSTFHPAEPNQLYFEADQRSDNAYRYISLALLDRYSSTLGVLNPALNPGGPRPPLEVQSDGRTWIPGARIVPGSEVVKGPDMRPGPNYGKEITYTRVPRGSDPRDARAGPGPNEYMINYEDIPNRDDPSRPLEDIQKAGTIIFDSQPDPERTPPDPSNPDGRPRTHWLPVFSYGSDGVLNQPAAPIRVTYQIQNNRPTDVVKADYLTRELMTVALGVRLYDFASGQPQQVVLTQKIQVRNIQR